MRRRTFFGALCGAGLGLGLGRATAQTPDPQGLEPDLPAGNGELFAISGVTPEGVELIATCWVTKVSGIKMDAFWAVYDEANWLRLEAQSRGDIVPAPIALASGRLNLPEPRGSIHAVLAVAFGELRLLYTSPNDESTQVSAQEIGSRPLGIKMQQARTVVMPVRADLPVVTR